MRRLLPSVSAEAAEASSRIPATSMNSSSAMSTRTSPPARAACCSAALQVGVVLWSTVPATRRTRAPSASKVGVMLSVPVSNRAFICACSGWQSVSPVSRSAGNSRASYWHKPTARPTA